MTQCCFHGFDLNKNTFKNKKYGSIRRKAYNGDNPVQA